MQVEILSRPLIEEQVGIAKPAMVVDKMGASN
jgi:hypothetical protein